MLEVPDRSESPRIELKNYCIEVRHVAQGLEAMLEIMAGCLSFVAF